MYLTVYVDNTKFKHFEHFNTNLSLEFQSLFMKKLKKKKKTWKERKEDTKYRNLHIFSCNIDTQQGMLHLETKIFCQTLSVNWNYKTAFRKCMLSMLHAFNVITKCIIFECYHLGGHRMPANLLGSSKKSTKKFVL